MMMMGASLPQHDKTLRLKNNRKSSEKRRRRRRSGARGFHFGRRRSLKKIIIIFVRERRGGGGGYIFIYRESCILFFNSLNCVLSAAAAFISLSFRVALDKDRPERERKMAAVFGLS